MANQDEADFQGDCSNTFSLPSRLVLQSHGTRRRVEAIASRADEFLDLCWDSVIVTDSSDTITYWNKGAERAYGWTRKEAVGRYAPDLFKTEGDLPLDEIYQISLREGHWEGELRHTCKNGSRIIVFSQWTVQRDPEGNPTGWLKLNTDITLRKEAELALNREREFSMRLIASSMDGISAFDRDRYTEWNRAMEDLTGVPRKDAIGRYVFDVLPFLEEIGERKYFQAALEGKSVSSNDRPYWVASANRKGFFEARYSPIRVDAAEVDDSEHVNGGLAMMRDITERRTIEESLRRLSASLLQVQDEERHRIARELHDGTTQTLMGIAMNLGALERLELKGRAAEILAETAAMADRAVQEVRTTSYLLHPPELDFIGLAGAVRSYSRGFSKRTGIQTMVEISPDLKRLPKEIEIALFRIVQESLSNVHRHSQSARATIKVLWDSNRVIEEIQDFGRGMQSVEALNGTDEESFLGVGIAGMRARVRQLGGEMEVDSSPRGTMVRVIIPTPRDLQNSEGTES